MPQTLREIESNAFSNCTSLQSINIPNGVTKIRKSAFFMCKQIQSISLPQTLQEIESVTFSGCSSLQYINIPSKVTKINQSTFYDCRRLQSIKLPQNLQEIKNESFFNCNSLQSINIPPGVTSIGTNAFNGCEQLQSVTLSKALQEIKSLTFFNCKSLQSISIPNGVTKIGSSVFQKCGQLQSVTLHETLQVIGRSSLCNCTSLQSITIPESVTKIENFAFGLCSALQMIVQPKHTTIEGDVFADCDTLHRTNEPNIINWLQTRFDNLPLHQLCYSINGATIDKLASIQVDNKALTAEDAMGMTPLHVLCSNPFATPDMIKQLVSKSQHVAQVRNIINMTPLDIYLINKHVISSVDYQRVSTNDLSGVSPVAVALLADGVEWDINEMIDMGLEFQIMDVILALNGRYIGEEVNKKNKLTGLYPFMSGVISHCCKLADVYTMTMMNINNLKEN